MTRHLRLLTLACTITLVAATSAVAEENQILPPSNATMSAPPLPSTSLQESKGFLDAGYPPAADPTPQTDRVNFHVDKSQRGTSLLIPEQVVAKFCGDFDGCTLRLGLYNWDNSGRVASRDALFYYNIVNHAWRSSLDHSGTDFDGTTASPLYAWACYFTDGMYKDWTNLGDSQLGFGLLSWNDGNFVADCILTIID